MFVLANLIDPRIGEFFQVVMNTSIAGVFNIDSESDDDANHQSDIDSVSGSDDGQ